MNPDVNDKVPDDPEINHDTDVIYRFKWPASWVPLRDMKPHDNLARLVEILLELRDIQE
jgi:hypothetical protein